MKKIKKIMHFFKVNKRKNKNLNLSKNRYKNRYKKIVDNQYNASYFGDPFSYDCYHSHPEKFEWK